MLSCNCPGMLSRQCQCRSGGVELVPARFAYRHKTGVEPVSQPHSLSVRLCYDDAPYRRIQSQEAPTLKNCADYKSVPGLVLMTLLVAAHSSGQTIAPASGKAMCSALTPEDFIRAGVPVLRLQEANLDDAKSAYCIFEGKSGKVEMDIYDPAGDTPAEAQNATRAAQAAIGGQFQTVLVEGADEASSNATSQGATDSSIVVQKGTTVFNISIPKAADAQQQLVKLSEIVISRLKQ